MTLTPKFTVGRTDAIERLELVRLASDINKGKFANTLGMYASNYSRLLKGEFFLTTDQLYTIWQLYGADPAYIMVGRVDGLNAGLLAKIQKLDETA